jgi:HD superfamily phosphodiesterase
MVGTHEARALARDLLEQELPRRWRHVGGVAARVGQIAGLLPETREMLVAAAWLHDIGYASVLVDTGFHPIDGGRHLRRLAMDERVVNLVAHHSCARIEAELRGLTSVLETEFPRDPALPHDEP